MNVHVIVAPSSRQKDPLKYRRHRLAEFLLEQPETEQVIWVCPDERGFRAIHRRPKIEVLTDGVIEFRVFDCKGIVRHFEILQELLLKDLKRHCTLDKHRKFYLWYTYPAFSRLTKLGIWSKVIYDCSDLWSQMKSGERYSWIHAIRRKISNHTENRIMEWADQCFASSIFLFNRLVRYHHNVMLVENGVDYNRFLSNVSYSAQDHHIPTVGFVGGLKPWKINFQLLLELAVAKRDWNISIIGPLYGDATEEVKWLMEQPNVKYTPYIPYDKVPEVIQYFDAGLLLYLENDYNKAVFPLKLFEYLAAGVPVVGCGLPSTKSYVAEHIYAHVPSRVEDVIAACGSMIARRYDYIEERKALARQADWNQKFEMMWLAVNQ